MLLPQQLIDSSPNQVIGIGEGSCGGVKEYRMLWIQILNDVVRMFKRGGNEKGRTLKHPQTRKKRKLIVLIEEDYWSLKEWHGFLSYTTNPNPRTSHRSTISPRNFLIYIQRHLFPYLFPHNRTKEFVEFMYTCYLNNIPVFGVDIHGERQTKPVILPVDDHVWKQHLKWEKDPESYHTECLQSCVEYIHQYARKIMFGDRETRTLFFAHNFYVSHKQSQFQGWSLATYANRGTTLLFNEEEQGVMIPFTESFCYPEDTIIKFLPKDDDDDDDDHKKEEELIVLDEPNKLGSFIFTTHSTKLKWEDKFNTKDDDFDQIVLFRNPVKPVHPLPLDLSKYTLH
jgi:hypothetical protein